MQVGDDSIDSNSGRQQLQRLPGGGRNTHRNARNRQKSNLERRGTGLRIFDNQDGTIWRVRGCHDDSILTDAGGSRIAAMLTKC
jgi:hypothetical protein